MADQAEARELLKESKSLLDQSRDSEINVKTRQYLVSKSQALSLLVIASVVADMEFADEE